jgi:hypothetical protein
MIETHKNGNVFVLSVLLFLTLIYILFLHLLKKLIETAYTNH